MNKEKALEKAVQSHDDHMIDMISFMGEKLTEADKQLLNHYLNK